MLAPDRASGQRALVDLRVSERVLSNCKQHRRESDVLKTPATRKTVVSNHPQCRWERDLLEPAALEHAVVAVSVPAQHLQALVQHSSLQIRTVVKRSWLDFCNAEREHHLLQCAVLKTAFSEYLQLAVLRKHHATQL